MEELLRAKEIHEQVINLDEQIVKLESSLDKIFKESLDGSVKLNINLKGKEKLELDQDGSIVGQRAGSSIFEAIADFNKALNESIKTKESFETELSESELVLMFATLLRHKQEKRKALIKEFNELSIKLKI